MIVSITRVAAAIVLIVGAGLIQGVWTDRWGVSPQQVALRSRIESIPLSMGEWQGKAFELPAEDRAVAGATACFGAVYTNASRGVSISVLLLGGLPGKISTHTPDVCYRGSGYTLSSPAEFGYRYRSGGDERTATFRTSLASRGGTNPSSLRIFWTWNESKGWSAPENPRWTFASSATLCKLYVVRETWGQAAEAESDPCKDFLAVFLPELDRRVFLATDETQSTSR
jgi:Protein of unknown function (DUF3485)